MALIALTGGIASGKSTIAARLAGHGAVVIDADQVVRDVQAAGSPVLEQMAEAFGADILLSDGSLDRASLGSRVFGDADALTRLNAIVHPAVRAESKRRMNEALAREPQPIVIYDVPLLVEARVDDPWELIVVAHAPAHVRLQRLVELRGMDASAAQDRVDAQVSDEKRLAIADVVIDTAGTLEHTEEQVDAFWKKLTSE